MLKSFFDIRKFFKSVCLVCVAFICFFTGAAYGLSTANEESKNIKLVLYMFGSIVAGACCIMSALTLSDKRK